VGHWCHVHVNEPKNGETAWHFGCQQHTHQWLAWSGSHNTEIADGTLVQVRRISNVPLTFVRYGETVRGTVQIMPDETASSLFGISHIRHVRTLKVKNK
jgi:hypothetical protein